MILRDNLCCSTVTLFSSPPGSPLTGSRQFPYGTRPNQDFIDAAYSFPDRFDVASNFVLDIFIISDSQIRRDLSGIVRIVPGILLLNSRTVKEFIAFYRANTIVTMNVV